jgi:endonuclease III
MENTIEVIAEIEEDFEKRRPPFNNIEFPEERLLRELSKDDGEKWRLSAEDKLAAISLFSTLDYNRDANQLVDKILDAADHSGINVFNPHEVSHSKKGIEHLFEDVSFRYKSRDAHAWHKNCSIIVEEYNGRWTELLLEVGCDAPKLVEKLEEDGFNCLKGDKIAPMYARFIDQYVCDMNNVWELEIPVDTHIERLSKELFDASDLNKDEIRSEWRGVAIETGINRHIIDGGLWQIGNNWDEWGEDYWDKVTEQ